MPEHDEHNDEHNDEEKSSRSKKQEEVERPQPVIEDLLKDPTFDPKRKVRSQLAAYSMQHGVRALAPAELVDADGNVVEQPA